MGLPPILGDAVRLGSLFASAKVPRQNGVTSGSVAKHPEGDVRIQLQLHHTAIDSHCAQQPRDRIRQVGEGRQHGQHEFAEEKTVAFTQRQVPVPPLTRLDARVRGVLVQQHVQAVSAVKPPRRTTAVGVSVVYSPILTLSTTHSQRSVGRFPEAAAFDHVMACQARWQEFDIEVASIKPTE